MSINPLCPAPGQSEKINLNFYFNTFFWNAQDGKR